jgi:hypothetical protein
MSPVPLAKSRMAYIFSFLISSGQSTLRTVPGSPHSVPYWTVHTPYRTGQSTLCTVPDSPHSVPYRTVHTLYRTGHKQTLKIDPSFRYSLRERLASTVAVFKPWIFIRIRSPVVEPTSHLVSPLLQLSSCNAYCRNSRPQKNGSNYTLRANPCWIIEPLSTVSP